MCLLPLVSPVKLKLFCPQTPPMHKWKRGKCIYYGVILFAREVKSGTECTLGCKFGMYFILGLALRAFLRIELAYVTHFPRLCHSDPPPSLHSRGNSSESD